LHQEQYGYDNDQHRGNSESEIGHHMSDCMQNGGETGRSLRDFCAATLYIGLRDDSSEEVRGVMSADGGRGKRYASNKWRCEDDLPTKPK